MSDINTQKNYGAYRNLTDEQRLADFERCAFWECYKDPADLPEGQKMMLCSRCKQASGFRYCYCSRYVSGSSSISATITSPESQL